MLFQDHHHFFERSITGSLAESIDGTFYLAGTVQNTRYRIGGGQAEVIMAMATQCCFINIGNIIDQVSDLFAILVGQAITRGVGNIYYRCPGSNNLLNNFGQIIIVRSAGIFWPRTTTAPLRTMAMASFMSACR